MKEYKLCKKYVNKIMTQLYKANPYSFSNRNSVTFKKM